MGLDRSTAARYLRQGRRVYRTGGARQVAERAAALALVRLTGVADDIPLRPGDVADSSTLRLPLPARPPGRRPLHLAWVMAPPGPGSGGHTTIFRMVHALEQAGHVCSLHLYDRGGVDVVRDESVIRRWWPHVRATVHDADAGLPRADGVFATSWYTAHVVASRTPFPTRRFYFVQDFEPFFYPRGAEYALAEDTYRFGFTTVAIGEMVAGLLRAECGVGARVAPFGCDHAVYRFRHDGSRSGVAFYAVPGTPRRAYALGVLALQRFHEEHPGHPLHVFGDPRVDLPFPVHNHGRLAPASLAAVYDECVAGLALSFTNISLVAAEMLACGTVPVVNDHPFARADLPSPAVRWSRPTPESLASALGEAVGVDDIPGTAAAAAATTSTSTWDEARRVVVDEVEREVRRPALPV